MVRIIYPRLTQGNKQGVSYFEDIIKNKPNNYVFRGAHLSEEEMIQELYKESYALAKVASKKFRALLYGIILSALALIGTIIVLIII